MESFGQGGRAAPLAPLGSSLGPRMKAVWGFILPGHGP
jgi:hypothetical protein